MTIAWINAEIYTGEGFAEAMLTEGETILAVGTAEDILAASPQRSIDLRGRFVMPGFNDSHLHLLHVGESLYELNLQKARSVEEMIDLARDYLVRFPERCESALIGRGWNQDHFAEKRFPTKEDLDRISTDLPVALVRVCGHAAVLNSKALEALGITPSTPDPEGGVIEKKDGRLTGLLTETALSYSESLRPEYTREEVREQLKGAFRHAVRSGLTSAQSNDLSFPAALDLWKLLCEMEDAGEIPLRLREQVCLTDIGQLDYFFTRARRPRTSRLALGPLKVLKDGSLGARTALMSEDYADAPGERGTLALSDSQHEKILRWAEAHGRSLITHVIGDGALQRTLDIYEKAEDPSKHGLVHCQISTPAQLRRIARLKTFVMAQPIFLDYDLQILESRVAGKAASSYAFGTLLRSGVSVSLGTDAPVEDLAPLPNLYCAVSRTDLSGRPEGGFHAEHAMSLKEAIDAYTFESAAQEACEAEKGRLLPGYFADFVVLDENPFEKNPKDLLQNRVLLTVVGGEIVYEALHGKENN